MHVFLVYSLPIDIAESGMLEDSQDSVINTTSGLLSVTTPCNSSILLVYGMRLLT
jgi:hypothetical protein